MLKRLFSCLFCSKRLVTCRSFTLLCLSADNREGKQNLNKAGEHHVIKFLITDWLFSFSLDSCQSVKRDEIFLLYVYNVLKLC